MCSKDLTHPDVELAVDICGTTLCSSAYHRLVKLKWLHAFDRIRSNINSSATGVTYKDIITNFQNTRGSFISVFSKSGNCSSFRLGYQSYLITRTRSEPCEPCCINCSIFGSVAPNGWNAKPKLKRCNADNVRVEFARQCLKCVLINLAEIVGGDCVCACCRR